MSGAWRGYYLTAYGIAVKHGFVGTEEEWLETLVGVPGAAAELRLEEETETVQWRLEGEEEWNDLFCVAALRDEVVNQTLETAATAAEQACEARDAAEGAKEQVFTARDTASTAAEEAKAAARQTAANQASAAAAAEKAERAGQAILGETAASEENAAAARAAAKQAKASEEVVAESARQATQAGAEAVNAQRSVLEAAEKVQQTGEAVLNAVETAADAKTTAQTAAEAAQTARTAAEEAEAEAKESAAEAAESAKDLNAAAIEAKSWAVGGTGTRAGEDTDNARYYKEQARQIAGGEFATPTEVMGAIGDHNADTEAHPALWETLRSFRRKVLRVRWRDTSKDDFGLGDETVYLEVGPYTGTVEVAVQLSGELYDAANISHNGTAIPDGNFIIHKEEC